MRLNYVILVLLLALMKSAQGQQTAENWFYQGVVLQWQDKQDKAIKACDEAIWLNPDLAGPLGNKGVALAHQGKYDKAVRLDPNYANAWYNNGIVIHNQDKTKADAPVFAKAIGVSKNETN